MSRSVNDILLDEAIRHAHLLEQVKNGEVRKVAALLERDVFPALLNKVQGGVDRIGKRGVGYSLNATERGKSLASSTRSLLVQAMRKINDEYATPVMKLLAVSEAEWQVAVMSRATTAFNLEFNVPNLPQLRSIVTSVPMEGKLMKDWYDDLAHATQDRVLKAINTGLGAGEDGGSIIRRLRGTRAEGFTDGALQTTRNHADSIVRTSANHVSTHARERTYEENSDFIKGIRIVATLDGRTTAICRSEDGKVYPPGEGRRPPFHWKCRTTTVPVLKAASELGIPGLKDLPPGTRGSMNGEVSETLNYNDWLKKQPKAFQDRVLGPERGELFRKHKLTMDSFVNEQGKLLTIEQLRKAEGLAS